MSKSRPIKTQCKPWVKNILFFSPIRPPIEHTQITPTCDTYAQHLNAQRKSNKRPLSFLQPGSNKYFCFFLTKSGLFSTMAAPNPKVVNLSSKPLTRAQVSLLSRGLLKVLSDS